MFDRRKVAPVREGDELDVKIEAVGEKGDGIAKTQGFVLFISNTKAGDEVRVRVTKVLKSVGFAEVIGKSKSPIVSSSHMYAAKKDTRKEEEAEVAELEKASKTHDSEDFGEEPAEAEEIAEKPEDITKESGDITEEPRKEASSSEESESELSESSVKPNKSVTPLESENKKE